MKAIKKSDGKQIDVKPCNLFTTINGSVKRFRMYKDSAGTTYKPSEIELIPDEPAKEDKEDKPIDWEQRRYEIAKECVANMIQHSVSDAFDSFRENQSKDDGDHTTSLKEYLNYEKTMTVHYAIEYADELIKQLKGE